MPRKKKTDAEAPVPTISSDSSIPKNHTGSQEYDSETLETILNYNMRNYLDADSLAAYDDASAMVHAANEKRAEAIMNPTSDKYTETRNGIRGVDFSVAFEEKRHYEALAAIAFVTRYGEPEYIPALEAAYRIAIEQIVTEQREKLAKRLQTYGKSIEEAKKIDDALAADGVQYTSPYMPILSDTSIPHDTAEYDVLQLMSDGALAEAFSTELVHISTALEKAYLARDSVEVATTRFISFLSETGTDVLERKWTCGHETSAAGMETVSPKQYKAGPELLSDQSAVARVIFDKPAHWQHTGETSVKVSGKDVPLRANIQIRIDAPKYEAGELLLPDSDLLDFHFLNGFDEAVYTGICSILYNSAANGMEFDPQRKMYLSTIHSQIAPSGKRCTKTRLVDIASSLKRLGSMRIRIQCPLYEIKKGVPIESGYSTEFPHLVEYVPGVDTNKRGEKPYIRILEVPPNYRYSLSIKQYSAIPRDRVERPGLTDSTEAIGIRIKLLNYITKMKRMDANSFDVPYDVLYRAAGTITRDMTPKRLTKVRENVIGIARRELDAWALSEDPEPIIGIAKCGRGSDPVRLKGNAWALRIHAKR